MTEPCTPHCPSGDCAGCAFPPESPRTIQRHTGQSRVIGCEIIAALVKGPRTIEDILEMVDCSKMVVRYWVRDLQESGLVRVSGYVERGPNRATGKRSTGRRRVVYAWQETPFAMADAEAA